MATTDSSARNRSAVRKSIAHMPSPDTIIDTSNKENLTIDLAGLKREINNTKIAKATTKKSRSKSLGPGGLEELKQDVTIDKKASAPFIKSILKHAIPLSPLQEIPARRNTNERKSPSKEPRSPIKTGMSIDFSNPDRSPRLQSARVSGANKLSNPFRSDQDIEGNAATRSGKTDEQHAEARAKEDEERRLKEKAEALKAREARRKSLANRRVSFAPEATLHRWDVIEFEESTTSSASTDATRRASAMVQGVIQGVNGDGKVPQSGRFDQPEASLPAHEQAEGMTVTTHENEKKRRRRSSGIPPMNFNNPDDILSSSPYSAASGIDDNSPARTTASGTSESGSETDEDGDTAMSLDQDPTGRTAGSADSPSSSTASSARLEVALRQAARQAGTRGIEFDENGDLSMVMADDETTAAFKPFMQPNQGLHLRRHPSALQDQENVNPFSPAFRKSLMTKQHEPSHDNEMSMDMTAAVGRVLPQEQTEAIDSDMSMNMTRAVGGILPGPQTVKKRKSIAGLCDGYGRDPEENSIVEDDSMDITMAYGGIQYPGLSQARTSVEMEEEANDGVSVDLETAEESIKASHTRNIEDIGPTDSESANVQLLSESRRASINSMNGEEEMEMTTALGTIIEEPEPSSTIFTGNETMGMELTKAVGGILPQSSHGSSRDHDQDSAADEGTDVGDLTFSPVSMPSGSPRKSPFKRTPLKTKRSTLVKGSVGLTTESAGRAQTSSKDALGPISVPGSPAEHVTPVPKPRTPRHQITPQPPRPETPSKTPPPSNVSMRTGSPKRLFKKEIKQASSSLNKMATPQAPAPHLFAKTELYTSGQTPSVILQPYDRRLSGQGIDKEGLGSPHIAAVLDRRGSISKNAIPFSPLLQTTRGVRFDDPRKMSAELDRAREVDERRESGRFILEQDADQQGQGEGDVTRNLREMIGSLTPKKKDTRKGRKSLFMGSAKGVLGKRPAELDNESDVDGTPKRLRGRLTSPVKKVRLPAPPAKSETIGRVTRSGKALDVTSGNERPTTPIVAISPVKSDLVTTPKGQGRFKDAEAISVAQKPPPVFGSPAEGDIGQTASAEDDAEDRISLQDFLNMTSIRFMELTTTKRRQTTATSKENSDGTKTAHGCDLESCVMAGTCTLPMLELYQHSCRELKHYIAEGRDIVREIEADTLLENPPLFKEYMSATPDLRLLMDNQFKNVKTHARLLSKGMWYEWRGNLVEGLKEGLTKIDGGMDEDEVILATQEAMLDSVLPGLIERKEALAVDCENLEAQAAELDECDPQELDQTRQRLTTVDEDIETRKRAVEELQIQLKEKEERVEAVTERMEETVAEIQEADRVREECKGWSATEVKSLQATVGRISSATGWTITSAFSTCLTLHFRSTLQLFFDTASFQTPQANNHNPLNPSNSPISLTLLHNDSPSTHRRFFLQLLQAHLHALRQAEHTTSALLRSIAVAWDKASDAAEQIRRLEVDFRTEVSIVSDETLRVRAAVLLHGSAGAEGKSELMKNNHQNGRKTQQQQQHHHQSARETQQTKLHIFFDVHASLTPSGDLNMSVHPRVEVVYGDKIGVEKMEGFLKNVVADGEKEGSWADGVRRIRDGVRGRGKKG